MMAVVAAELTLSRHMNLNDYADKIEKAALNVKFYHYERNRPFLMTYFRPLLRASMLQVTSVERLRPRIIPKLSLPS